VSRRLTLAREREMLAEIRETLRLVPRDEYERWLRDRIGVAGLDQLQAAAQDTQRRVARDSVALGLRDAHWRPDTFGPEVLAGLRRCLAASPCEHAFAGGRPLIAILAARVITCEDCAGRFRGPLVAARRGIAVGDDRLCDFCLTEPADNYFRPVEVAAGPARLVGEMCSECFERAAEGARR
jgi:hypothetical protein